MRPKVDLANKILAWVIFARRPITIEELRCALAVELGDSDLNEEGLLDRGYLLSVCGGLVMTNGDTEIVRFIHYTLQEYFERARHLELSSAQTYLATTCITYLSFSTFASQVRSEISDKDEIGCLYQVWDATEDLKRQDSLVMYASKHWGDHARECGSQDRAIRTIVRRFLTLKTNVSFSKVMVSQRRAAYQEVVSDLHMAAAFGIEWLVEELLQQGASVDTRDSDGRTPLHEAATGGHTNVIKSLLERGADPNSRDRRTRDAVELAAKAGHEPATRFLLQQALLPDMLRIISDVAEEGHLGVLRLVLESLNSPEKATYLGTALLAASLSGHEACIRLLLGELKDLKMSEIQSDLDVALFGSLRNDNSDITHLLLEYGADLTKGIHRAAGQCNVAGARRLLDHGANIEAVNSEGDRPIHLSLRSLGFIDERERMLKLLLERGAEINAYGANKECPLIIVARRGQTELVQQLLDNGANIRAKAGNFNRSAIEWAVLRGHQHIVQLLLRYQRPVETSEALLALTRFHQASEFCDTE